jgi:hypothetical protein
MSDVLTPIRKEENLTILRPFQLCLGSCKAQHVDTVILAFFKGRVIFNTLKSASLIKLRNVLMA